MSALNQLYLSKLSKQYKLESLKMFESGFSSYCLSLNKRNVAYLILCTNSNASFNIGGVLDRIALFDNARKMGSSYLCVMPMENPSIEQCTHCNGKSFVHFIFFDVNTNSLMYDKKIYYLGSKQIKKLIDIYQNCFNDLIQSDC